MATRLRYWAVGWTLVWGGCRHHDTGLAPAAEPCAGPREVVRVRVLDSAELTQDDPLAFRREPMLSFVVALAVVEVVQGEFTSPRLGILVHSPSEFAGDVWGFGASPQMDAAQLDLRWSPKYCMFELAGMKPPERSNDARGKLEFKAPTVHSQLIR